MAIGEEEIVIYPANREEFRAWLLENHQTATKVWLHYYKVKSGKPCIRWAEAVQEALCFGWIDSKINPIDEENYRQVFTPRKANSEWSAVNKRYIEQLAAQGLMMPAGWAAIERAKQNGSWEKLDKIEALEIPDDLAAAFAAHPPALAHFETFPKTVKKSILRYIYYTKDNKKREERVLETAILASQNLRVK